MKRMINSLTTTAASALVAALFFTSCAETEVSEEVRRLREAQLAQVNVRTALLEADLLLDSVSIEREKLTLAIERAEQDADLIDAEKQLEDQKAALEDAKANAEIAVKNAADKLKDEALSDLAADFASYAAAIGETNNKEDEIDDKEEEIAEKQEEMNNPGKAFDYTGFEVAQAGGIDEDGDPCTFCLDYSVVPDNAVDELELRELREAQADIEAQFALFNVAIADINAFENAYRAINRDSIEIIGAGLGEKEQAEAIEEDVNNYIDSLNFPGIPSVATPTKLDENGSTYATVAMFDAITDAITEALNDPSSTGITAKNSTAGDDADAFEAAIAEGQALSLQDVSLEDLMDDLRTLQGELEVLQAELAQAMDDEAGKRAIYLSSKTAAGL